MSRPYSANYAIGFMFVSGIILFFQGMCGIAYPEIFQYLDVPDDIVYVIAVLSVVIFMLTIMLFLGIPLAHKLSIFSLIMSIATDLVDVDLASIDFLGLVLFAISIASLILLLCKPCREFYKGWGTSMQFDD